MDATNTADNQENVHPTSKTLPPLDGGKGSVNLPALSWNVLRYKIG